MSYQTAVTEAVRSTTVDYSRAWVQCRDSAEPIDISVCIANWNCREVLRNCLASILDYPQGIAVEVVVVDNASSDGAADMVARDFPEVILVRNAENRGFAKASNQAARRSRGKYLLFLNNDTIRAAECFGQAAGRRAAESHGRNDWPAAARCGGEIPNFVPTKNRPFRRYSIAPHCCAGPVSFRALTANIAAAVSIQITTGRSIC